MKDKERLHVVREGLSSVWDSQGRRFVTFETGEEGDDSSWMQYIDGVLHVDWPLDEAPEVALARRGVSLPRGAFVASYVPGASAQIAVGDVLLDDIATLVLALCDDLLTSASSRVLRVRVEVA